MTGEGRGALGAGLFLADGTFSGLGVKAALVIVTRERGLKKRNIGGLCSS